MGPTALALVTVLAAWPFRGEVPPETVVIRATGPAGTIEITAARLKSYCERHPERSPREAGDDLVSFELLAQLAAERGLGDDPEVRRAADEAAVPRYLKEKFETSVTADSIPLALLKKSYEQNISFYKHPELRTVDHILVATKDLKKPTDPAQDESAQALSMRIAEDLERTPPLDDVAFRAFVDRYREDAHAAGLEVKAEAIPSMTRFSALVPEFIEASFNLRSVGEMSPMTGTSYGYHLIRLRGISPAADQTLEQATPDLRKRLLGEYRAMELRRMIDEDGNRIGTAINPAPIAPSGATP